MSLQNIGAANRGDAFYRYKMPKMVTKTEGKGNGIKTNIVNNVEIAKALARPASYTTKYFGCELGAQSRFDEKNGMSVVNGAHSTAKLSGLLDNFIKKYVQCYGCSNPETEIIITKTQRVTLKCAACGFISDVDMMDKLTTYIVKNPPAKKKGAKDGKAMRRAEKERLKEGEAIDEEQRTLKKEAKKKGSSKKKTQSSDDDRSSVRSEADQTEPVESDDDDNDVQWTTDTSLEAAERRMKEQLNAVTAEMVVLYTVETADNPKHRSNKNTKGNGEIITTHKNLVEMIRLHLEKEDASVSNLSSFIAKLPGTPQETMDALFLSLFEGIGKGFAKEVAKKIKHLKSVIQEDHSHTLLLNTIYSFCQKASIEAVKEVSLVLKVLYDKDVLDEEMVMEWYREQGLKRNDNTCPVLKNVEPFIEWLQNAESESDN